MDTDELTTREREIFALAAAGMSNRAIAQELGVSQDAVRYALKEIHSKLQTGGDRRKLTWRRWRSAGALFALPAGLKAAVATGSALVVVGAASLGVYLAYPGGEQPPADGRQANGCPESYTAWPGATLADFIVIGQTDRATVLALNPGLADGPLAPGTEVRLPYNPRGTCAELEPTITPAPAAAYTVQQRDSCAGIAARLGVSVAALLTANPAIDGGCSNLVVGQVIQVPAAGVPPAATAGSSSTGGTPTP